MKPNRQPTTLVKVLIPIYKPLLEASEYASLRQCCKVLSNYDKVIFKPEGLDVGWLTEQFPQLGVETFAARYFTSREAYSALLLSPMFYERFLDCKYILIYQPDAWVFIDQLTLWCLKDYDYVGAPVLISHPWMYWWRKLRNFFGLPIKEQFWDWLDRVGNGGFSLRKTHTFYDLAPRFQPIVNRWLHSQTSPGDITAEDVAWSKLLYAEGKRLPDWREALLFAFSSSHRRCYRLSHHRVPFGLHAWPKPKNLRFWQKRGIVF